jgi:hypothetical protein
MAEGKPVLLIFFFPRNQEKPLITFGRYMDRPARKTPLHSNPERKGREGVRVGKRGKPTGYVTKHFIDRYESACFEKAGKRLAKKLSPVFRLPTKAGSRKVRS